MDKVQARAKLIRKFIDAVNEAKKQGVKEPEQKSLQTIKAIIGIKQFKNNYNLK